MPQQQQQRIIADFLNSLYWALMIEWVAKAPQSLLTGICREQIHEFTNKIL